MYGQARVVDPQQMSARSGILGGTTTARPCRTLTGRDHMSEDPFNTSVTEA